MEHVNAVIQMQNQGQVLADAAASWEHSMRESARELTQLYPTEPISINVAKAHDENEEQQGRSVQELMDHIQRVRAENRERAARGESPIFLRDYLSLLRTSEDDEATRAAVANLWESMKDYLSRIANFKAIQAPAGGFRRGEVIAFTAPNGHGKSNLRVEQQKSRMGDGPYHVEIDSGAESGDQSAAVIMHTGIDAFDKQGVGIVPGTMFSIDAAQCAVSKEQA